MEHEMRKFINEFKKLSTEGLIDWNEESTRAVVNQMKGGRGKRYSINIAEPFTLNTTDQELFTKLKFYLNTHRIPFDHTEEDI